MLFEIYKKIFDNIKLPITKSVRLIQHYDGIKYQMYISKDNIMIEQVFIKSKNDNEDSSVILSLGLKEVQYQKYHDITSYHECYDTKDDIDYKSDVFHNIGLLSDIRNITFKNVKDIDRNYHHFNISDNESDNEASLFQLSTTINEPLFEFSMNMYLKYFKDIEKTMQYIKDNNISITTFAISYRQDKDIVKIISVLVDMFIGQYKIS